MNEHVTISPSIHEAVIARHMLKDVNDSALQGLHDSVKQARELITKAQATSAIVLPNDLKTLAARHKEARHATFALLEKATKSLDEAVKAAQGEIAAIQTKLSGPPPAKDLIGETRQRELRERLSLLPEAQRKQIIGDAVKSDDQVLVAAVLNAPSWLTGLSDAGICIAITGRASIMPPTSTVRSDSAKPLTTRLGLERSPSVSLAA